MDRATITRELESITSRLVSCYKPEKIILFGSAAWGGEAANDIDLLIVKEDVPHYGADRIMELYHLMNVDVPVDYLVYKPGEVSERLSMGDPFMKRVFEKGRLLYG
ncbi:MAG: nucleotidyltransferase domain-containing protein [Nitrospirae bacterium]|nr:nucleotidyltransferase domain-containing protein [Nitrospirota bacterium]